MRAIQEPAQEIAAVIVGPQPEPLSRWGKHLGDMQLVGIVGRKDWRQQGYRDHGQDNRPAHGSQGLIAQEAAHCLPPTGLIPTPSLPLSTRG